MAKKTQSSNEKNSKYKILSIDGGGAKGFFVTYFLFKLKKEYNINVLDEFDMFIGTSVGAILVFCVLFEHDMEGIYSYFSDPENDLFADEFKLQDRIKKFFFSKYDNKRLEKELNTLFPKIKLKDLKTDKHWLITSTNFSTGKPIIFGSKEFTNLNKKYMNLTIQEALLASSAAPTYFEPYVDKDSKEVFVDGGLWANSPNFLGIIYALKTFDKKLEDIKMLSFGTTRIDDKNFFMKREINLKEWHFENEFINLMSSVLNTHQNFSNFASSMLLKENFLRMSPVNKDSSQSTLSYLSSTFFQAVEESWELNKENLVKFIKEGKNVDYEEMFEKIYN